MNLEVRVLDELSTRRSVLKNDGKCIGREKIHMLSTKTFCKRGVTKKLVNACNKEEKQVIQCF